MDVLFCITDDLWEPLLVTMNSIVTNSDEKINFHIATSDLKQEHKDAIENFFYTRKRTQGEIYFYLLDRDKLCRNPVLWENFAIEYAYRILVLPLLFNLEKIIYMDVDVVVTGDIRELWNIDFEGNLIIASESNRIDHTPQKCIRNIPIESPYYYDGLMIMNLKEIRKLHIIEAFEAFCDNYILHDKLVDQDFVNYFFAGKIKTLSNKYHSMCSEGYGHHMHRIRCSEKALVLHWYWQRKPWNEYGNDRYLYDLDVYYSYCQIEQISKTFKEKVRENVLRYENNIWIPLENTDKYDKGLFTNVQLLLDYAEEKIKYGNIFHRYLMDNQFHNIAIYGMNDIARIMIEEVNKMTDVQVSVVIDRSGKSDNFCGVKVSQPKEYLDSNQSDNVDVILVMVMNEFLNIENYLKRMKVGGIIRPISEMVYAHRNLLYKRKVVSVDSDEDINI